jgi:hypothetical protein
MAAPIPTVMIINKRNPAISSTQLRELSMTYRKKTPKTEMATLDNTATTKKKFSNNVIPLPSFINFLPFLPRLLPDAWIKNL